MFIQIFLRSNVLHENLYVYKLLTLHPPLLYTFQTVDYRTPYIVVPLNDNVAQICVEDMGRMESQACTQIQVSHTG